MGKKFKKQLTKKGKKLLVRKLHYFLNKQTCEIKLAWSYKNLGLHDPLEKTIYINIYDSAVKIFLHEYLHEIYPDMNHRTVYSLTSKIFRKLTPLEIKNLAKKIMLGRKITLKDFETMPKPDKAYGTKK